MKSLALLALQASLSFMKKQFEKKEVREYMLDLLVPLCTDANKQMQVQSMQCMMDVIKQLYPYLKDYIQIFFQILSPLCFSKDYEIAVPAIEIWSTLAQEDIE